MPNAPYMGPGRLTVFPLGPINSLVLLLSNTQVLNYNIQAGTVMHMAVSYDVCDSLAYGSKFYIIVHHIGSWKSVNIFNGGKGVYL